MAYRLITQVVLIGTRVVGRAFAEAYKQAAAASSYQRAQQQGGGGGGDGGGGASAADRRGASAAGGGITLQEAVQILNVKPPRGGLADMDEVLDRFRRLYDANDPKNGGSFYLQSKIVRARERLEAEAAPLLEKAALEKEIREGWKPNIYKDK